MKTNKLALLIPWLVAGARLAAAAPSAAPAQVSAQSAAYQNSVEQERLRAQTERARKELLALLDEYKAYPAAAGEIDELKAVVGSLQTLSDKDMVEVVRVLRASSQAGLTTDAKDKLLDASHNQKNIQGVLQALADRLASEKEESAMRKRLMDLLLRQMTHQHQAQKIGDGSYHDYELPSVTKLAIDEQNAIGGQVTQTFAALSKLTGRKESYAAALAAGTNAQVPAHAEAASVSVAAKDMPKTVEEQGTVIAGLQAMLLAFDSTTPTAERLQALISQAKELAAKENQLAKNTESVYFMAQQEVKDPQQQIDDQAAAMTQEIAQLSQPAAAELAKGRETMHGIDETFKTKNVMEHEEKRWDIIAQEKTVSQNFAQTAALLEAQADALAAASGGSQGSASSPSSSEDSTLEAIERATQAILDAEDKLQGATRIVQQKGSEDAAKRTLGNARADLAKASGEVASLGSEVSADAAADLKSSDGKAADALSKVGTDADTMRNSWTIGGAKEDAGKALAALQDAANRIAAARARAQAQAQGASQNGSLAPNGQRAGGPGTPEWRNTSRSLLATFSTKEREALAVPEHEPVPAEYNTMVDQYRRNLANGGVPVP